MENSDSEIWRKCTTCKKSIGYNANYLVCTVSTCNTKRAAMAFCGVECWDAHLPIMNHREAYYQQKKSPKSRQEALQLEAAVKVKPKVEATNAKPEVKSSVIIRRKSS